MIRVTSRTQESPWLVGEFVESYACWREESATVREAYERWSSAEVGDRALAWAAYGAALDREQHAADAYRECAERFADRRR
jgi:hypothetical protein